MLRGNRGTGAYPVPRRGKGVWGDRPWRRGDLILDFRTPCTYPYGVQVHRGKGEGVRASYLRFPLDCLWQKKARIAHLLRSEITLTSFR